MPNVSTRDELGSRTSDPTARYAAIARGATMNTERTGRPERDTGQHRERNRHKCGSHRDGDRRSTGIVAILLDDRGDDCGEGDQENEGGTQCRRPAAAATDRFADDDRWRCDRASTATGELLAITRSLGDGTLPGTLLSAHGPRLRTGTDHDRLSPGEIDDGRGKAPAAATLEIHRDAITSAARAATSSGAVSSPDRLALVTAKGPDLASRARATG